MWFFDEDNSPSQEALPEELSLDAEMIVHCPFCGDYAFEGERTEAWHAAAECIGGAERFDTEEEARGEW